MVKNLIFSQHFGTVLKYWELVMAGNFLHRKESFLKEKTYYFYLSFLVVAGGNVKRK